MSLRFEQRRSLVKCRELLVEILNKPQRTTLRSEIRMKAASALRHFPILDDRGEPIWSPDEDPPNKDAA